MHIANTWGSFTEVSWVVLVCKWYTTTEWSETWLYLKPARLRSGFRGVLEEMPLWPLCSMTSWQRDRHLPYCTEHCALQISANYSLVISANNGFVYAVWFSPSTWWTLPPGEVVLTSLGLCCSGPDPPICSWRAQRGKAWADSAGERPGDWE